MINIISSCTKKKKNHPDVARDLYLGEQHKRIVRAMSRHPCIATQLYIVSAQYGIIPAETKIEPYEKTFAGRKQKEIRAIAGDLKIPSFFRDLLNTEADLNIVCLGNDYLTACGYDKIAACSAPTLVFATKKWSDKQWNRSRVCPLQPSYCTRFGAGHVAIKGELTSRLLNSLETGITVKQLYERTDIFDFLIDF